VDEWVCNAIGTGIKPQSMHPTLAVKEKLQALWSLWGNEADAAGMTDIYGLQAFAFRSMVEGGECFARRHDRDLREGLSVPLQFQLIEAEQLPFYLARPTPNTPQGNVVRASIEFDPSGRRTAYYFYKQHPGERIFFPTDLELMWVPAAEVMHLFRSLRPGQLRGVPWMANALVRLWELDQYDDAELLRKKFAAMMMGFITRQNPDDAFFPNATPQAATDAGGVAGSGEQGVAVAQLEAGTMTELEPGEDVKFSEPADVGGNYEAFERIQLLRIAAGLGLPYDMLTGDLSKTSYSSIRAGLKARSMSINEMGLDEEEVDRQIARDNERADELGLVLDSDPRKTDARGQASNLLDTTQTDAGNESDSGDAPAASRSRQAASAEHFPVYLGPGEQLDTAGLDLLAQPHQLAAQRRGRTTGKR
jgi:lambda family phage portal protein